MSKTKFRRILPLLAVSWFLTCAGSDCTDSSEDGPDYAPGEVYVGFVPGTTQSQVEALASDLGLEVGDIIIFDTPADVWGAVFIVPEGEEREWILVIAESPIVSSTDYNWLLRVPPHYNGCSVGPGVP